MRTHYENLHVTEDAPDEVIRASYRALSLKHHPDTAGDKPQSKWKMQRINDSYAVLSDSQRKAAYDGELRRQRNPRPQPSKLPAAAQDTPNLHQMKTRRISHRAPRGLPASVVWLSDARLVIPLMAIIWLIVWWSLKG